MATFRKTPSGTWNAQVRRRGWPPVARTFRLKREAQEWAASIEHDMRLGLFARRDQAESTTVKDALDRYLVEVTPTKKPNTQKGHHSQAKALKSYFGEYSVAAVTAELVAKYRDKRLYGDGRAANTARVELALLSHVYETAIREWGFGLMANPVRAIRWPSPGPGRDRRLSPDEEQRLLRAADQRSNPMLGYMIRFALQTAMRASEIRGLRRGDVDLTRRIARLKDTKNNDSRTVPLTREAVKIVGAVLDHPSRNGSDVIFFGEPGRDGIRRGYEYKPSWRRLKQKVGLHDLRFHDLRHEAVSRLVERGLGDQEVAAISGHKSMQMLRRYTHLRAEDLVERLDQL